MRDRRADDHHVTLIGERQIGDECRASGQQRFIFQAGTARPI